MMDDARQKLRTAIREPEKVPPYLRKKIRSPLRRMEASTRTSGLERQGDLLDDIRSNDEWVIVVLDACRYDELAAVWDHWFEGDLRRARAEGRDTFEYARLCWGGQWAGTTYLSGAVPVNSHALEFDDPHVNSLYEGFVPNEHIGEIVDVWEEEWDESLGVCPPEPVVDRAIERDAPRMVAHLFQPHAPYIGHQRELGHADNEHSSPGDGEPIDKPIWDRVRTGTISDDRLRELYRSNLRRALASVAVLVEELDDRDVYLIGDHGEALGEWGVYAHPRLEHARIREVPVAKIDRVNPSKRVVREFGHEAGYKVDHGPTAVENRLQELGYM